MARSCFPLPFRRADDGAAPPGAGRRAARRPGAVARRAVAAGGAAVAALSQELFRSQRGDAGRARARSAGARNRAPIRSVMSRSDARFVIWTSGLPTGSGAGTTRSLRAGTRHLRPAHRSAPPSRSTTPRHDPKIYLSLNSRHALDMHPFISSLTLQSTCMPTSATDEFIHRNSISRFSVCHIGRRERRARHHIHRGRSTSSPVIRTTAHDFSPASSPSLRAACPEHRDPTSCANCTISASFAKPRRRYTLLMQRQLLCQSHIYSKWRDYRSRADALHAILRSLNFPHRHGSPRLAMPSSSSSTMPRTEP